MGPSDNGNSPVFQLIFSFFFLNFFFFLSKALLFFFLKNLL